jgi:hypothetical protein
VIAERAADGVLQHDEQLVLGGVVGGRQRARGDLGPGSGLERQLAVLPGAAAQLHRRLVERELVRPGREATVAAKGRELRENRDERVVGCLLGEVLAVAAAKMRHCNPPPRDLEARRAQQQLVQARNGVVAGVARRRERVDPPSGLVVQRTRQRRTRRCREVG